VRCGIGGIVVGGEAREEEAAEIFLPSLEICKKGAPSHKATASSNVSRVSGWWWGGNRREASSQRNDEWRGGEKEIKGGDERVGGGG